MPIGDIMQKVIRGEPVAPHEAETLRLKLNHLELLEGYTTGLQTGTSRVSELSITYPLEVLYNEVFATDTTSVSLQIPSVYNGLHIFISGRGTKTGNSSTPLLTFNDDAGLNYSVAFLYNSNGTHGSFQDLTYNWVHMGQIPSASSSANLSGIVRADVFGLRSGFYKSVVATFGDLEGASPQYIYHGVSYGSWNNTAKVETITLSLETASDFAAGSQVVIYGVR